MGRELRILYARYNGGGEVHLDREVTCDSVIPMLECRFCIADTFDAGSILP